MIQKLYRIEVDIDLSSNPKIREMFNNQEAGLEMTAFFKEHKISVVGKEGNSEGKATHVDLEGTPVSLQKFVDDFLCDDSPGGVYTLIYRES